MATPRSSPSVIFQERRTPMLRNVIVGLTASLLVGMAFIPDDAFAYRGGGARAGGGVRAAGVRGSAVAGRGVAYRGGAVAGRGVAYRGGAVAYRGAAYRGGYYP